MRISKKILAGVLAALMAISMMPFTAFAATVSVTTGAELKTAVANAVSGDVIEFSADNTTYPETSGALVIPVDGKDITIDLKGHTQYFRVSGETTVSYPTDLFVLKNGAKLTVEDSVGGGAIYATYGANSAAYIFNVLDSSELVIDGGTFVMDAANYGGVIVYQNSADASTTINDGTFTANTGAKARRDYIINNTRGDVEINGGEFSTPRSFDYIVNAGNTADTNVTINDGDFEGTVNGTKGKLVVNGGTFKTFDGAVNDVSKYYADDVAQLEDGTVAVLPTATVTDITESTDYDVAKQFVANNDGEAFNNYKADFVVSVDKDVNTADVRLYGKFGSWDWTMFPEMTAEANTEYYLARDGYNWTPTYEEICRDVQTFSCGVFGAADEATTLTVKLVIYKEGVEPIVISSFTHNIPAKVLEDTMSITVADDIDLNINVVTDAPEADHVVYTFADPSTEDTSKTKEVTVDAKGDVTSFTVPLAPAQIRDDITATVYDEDGSFIREVTTSVADYCNQILGMTDAQLGAKATELKELAKATLDYGKAASDYFNYNEDDFDGYSIQLADPTSAINAATEAALAANGGNRINGDYGIVFSGVSYVAKSKPELRFYINTSSVTDIDVFESHLGEINNAISSNIGNAQIASLEQDGSYLLQVRNIDIADFGKKVVVHSYYNDSFVEFTPLTWVKAAIANPNLSDLGKAIGNYYLKAVGYFGENA